MNEFGNLNINSLMDDDSKTNHIWKLYHKAKESLPYKSRMENLTWRMMHINSVKSKKPILDPSAEEFDYIAHIKKMGQEQEEYSKHEFGVNSSSFSGTDFINNNNSEMYHNFEDFNMFDENQEDSSHSNHFEEQHQEPLHQQNEFLLQSLHHQHQDHHHHQQQQQQQEHHQQYQEQMQNHHPVPQKIHHHHHHHSNSFSNVQSRPILSHLASATSYSQTIVPLSQSQSFQTPNSNATSQTLEFDDFDIASDLKDMEFSHSHQNSIINLNELNPPKNPLLHTPSLTNIPKKKSSETSSIPTQSSYIQSLSNMSPFPTSSSLPTSYNSPLGLSDSNYFESFNKEQKFDMNVALKPKIKRTKTKKMKSNSPENTNNGNISGSNGSGTSAPTKGSNNDLQNQNISCTNCHTKTTPLWRRNPEGQPLCNACGLFLKLHGVVRPLSLKTDVIKKRQRNSNSTKKITTKDGDDLNPTALVTGTGDKEKDKKSPRKRKPVNIPSNNSSTSSLIGSINLNSHLPQESDSQPQNQMISQSNNSSILSNSFGLGISNTPLTNTSTPGSINLKREDDLHPINELDSGYLNSEYVPDDNLDWLSMAL